MKAGTQKAITLLKKLVATPSFSGEESATATLIEDFFREEKIPCRRLENNVWAASRMDPAKPTLLLNSHHDTVRPGAGWTRDPFAPAIEDGKLFGLGSNDAGGPLCALLAAFAGLRKKERPFNLVMAATAEEEISGRKGIELLLPHLGAIDAAIVGEPTGMQLAVAERGLLVLDCVAHGRQGHAAREEGVNAIYNAMKDIEWFRSFEFPGRSEWLGPVKMSVTAIEAGEQHNVIPGDCRFTVDVRINDNYSPEEILEEIARQVSSTVTPRSVRLRPSSIAMDHPLVVAGKKTGCTLYGSPTLSDQALLPFPSVKIGPGDSARSHTADEFIFCEEFEAGIDHYTRLIESYRDALVQTHSIQHT